MMAAEAEIIPFSQATLPLVSLNHVSFLCRSITRSVEFYEQVLGFISIKRPSSFNFQGAWLFNYGMGIHLLQCNSPEDVPIKRKEIINPKDNHISFQCSNMQLLMQKLQQLGIRYVTAVVEEGGIQVDQLFFHDPDGYMIEICNCDNLPVLPLSCPLASPPPTPPPPPPLPTATDRKDSTTKLRCGAEVLDQIIDNLVANMMHISF